MNPRGFHHKRFKVKKQNQKLFESRKKEIKIHDDSVDACDFQPQIHDQDDETKLSNLESWSSGLDFENQGLGFVKRERRGRREKEREMFQENEKNRVVNPFI